MGEERGRGWRGKRVVEMGGCEGKYGDLGKRGGGGDGGDRRVVRGMERRGRR